MGETLSTCIKTRMRNTVCVFVRARVSVIDRAAAAAAALAPGRGIQFVHYQHLAKSVRIKRAIDFSILSAKSVLGCPGSSA